jgi:hypothetical protein
MGLRVSAIKNPETETKRKESVKLKMEQETWFYDVPIGLFKDNKLYSLLLWLLLILTVQCHFFSAFL